MRQEASRHDRRDLARHTGSHSDSCASLVMLENVGGLLQQRRDTDSNLHPPQIVAVERDLEAAGFTVAHALTDAQRYGLPQRRNRVYIVASNMNGLSSDTLSSRFALAQHALELDGFVTPAASLLLGSPTGTLTEQQRERVREAKQQKTAKKAIRAGADVYISVHQSKQLGAEVGEGVTPCVRPNSVIFSHRLGRKLDAMDHLALQGITPQDCPCASSSAHSSHFKHDLAGNSFNAGQCLAAFLAALTAGALCPCSSQSDHNEGDHAKGAPAEATVPSSGAVVEAEGAHADGTVPVSRAVAEVS